MKMKLAAALNKRADLQKRIEDLKDRLIRNSKVQEGDTPAENPESLLNELDNNIVELEKMIKAINKTNSSTYVDNESIADMIAKRDAIGLKLSVLRSFLDSAAEKVDRYSKTEIKILSSGNVEEKQKDVDKLESEYAAIDTKLQGLNWTTDLIEN